MDVNWSQVAAGLAPEIVLLVGSLVVLMTGSFLPRRRLGVIRIITLAVLAAAGTLAAFGLTASPHTVFDGSYRIDTATGAARLIATAASMLIIVLGTDELRPSPRQAEICCLLLLATLGTVVLSGATDLMIVITGFLLASIPLYALVGLAFSPAASEAAMKTYFYGSLFGIVLMAGVTILYGVGGNTTYASLEPGLKTAPLGAVIFGSVAVLGGLMFKAGGVPGHFWIPDASQGAGSLAATFLTTVPKIGALIAAYRLILILPDTTHAHLLIGILAVASMTLGNLAAFTQTDPRRLLGWSTVSQVGYLLIPVAVAGRTDLALTSLLVYLAGYAVTNIAAFAAVAALPDRRSLSGYLGLSRTHPWLAAGVVVSLLGLVGTPPTAVFVGKLAVGTAAADGGSAWLTVALLANSMISLYYYLRWIIPTVGHSPDATRPMTTVHWGLGTAIAAGAASLVLGLTAAGLFTLFGLPTTG